ncbi:MAG: quinone-dependent dihydroorotate dehydrogenase [Saprospiraceae bacterium]|nr:quinone-dependent dihydroorotate dehydrogenase [Saprospiraceae bacterium]
MYQQLIKPFFFRFPAERAHHMAMDLLRASLYLPGVRKWWEIQRKKNAEKPVEIMGLHFPNPVGLAAGFDKDAKYLDLLYYLGFGYVEVGTVTPRPQPGNDRPRLFRLPKDQALINRMGFNNEGVDAMVERLKKYRGPLIIGGNIGKNKFTSNAEAVNDYLECFEKLFPYVDYFVVNVSSPNTPGLRALQDREPLHHLLSRLQEVNKLKPQPKPILLKIAPDMEDAQLSDVVAIVEETGLAGIIATNTTIKRDHLITPREEVAGIGAGGLSGQPVRGRAQEVARKIVAQSQKKLVVIGVGGIQTGADAVERMAAGCPLIQIYTGFIYEGPLAAYRILQML